MTSSISLGRPIRQHPTSLRWYQFSLRTLMFVMLLAIAFVSGLVTGRAPHSAPSPTRRSTGPSRQPFARPSPIPLAPRDTLEDGMTNPDLPSTKPKIVRRPRRPPKPIIPPVIGKSSSTGNVVADNNAVKPTTKRTSSSASGNVVADTNAMKPKAHE